MSQAGLHHTTPVVSLPCAARSSKSITMDGRMRKVGISSPAAAELPSLYSVAALGQRLADLRKEDLDLDEAHSAELERAGGETSLESIRVDRAREEAIRHAEAVEALISCTKATTTTEAVIQLRLAISRLQTVFSEQQENESEFMRACRTEAMFMLWSALAPIEKDAGIARADFAGWFYAGENCDPTISHNTVAAA